MGHGRTRPRRRLLALPREAVRRGHALHGDSQGSRSAAQGEAQHPHAGTSRPYPTSTTGADIAKYREKTEADLAWDRIRRGVQYRINEAAANWRDAKLNEVLPPLQDAFEAALLEGTVLELEAGGVNELLEAAFAEA